MQPVARTAAPAGTERGAPCGQCVLARQCPAAQALAFAAPQPGPLPRSFARGARLQREGERPAGLCFVKSGLLGVRQAGPDGVERVIAVIGPGFLIGQPLLQGMAALLTVQALTPVSACQFPPPLPERLLQPLQAPRGGLDPSVSGRYMRQSMLSLAAWSHIVRLPGPGQRLAAALCLIAGLLPPGAIELPSQGLLAELLCVSRESVNRVWRDFEARGLVQRRHGRAVELDLQALRRLLMSDN